jgi:hypothetical protein
MNLAVSSSLLSPYNYTSPDQGISFHFVNKHGITYSLALSDYSELFGLPNDSGCKLIFFVLTPILPPKVIPLDLRVKDTVVHFLMNYLERNPNIVFYVCSATDDKETQRQLVFDYWYKKHSPENIKRETKILEDTNNYFFFDESNLTAINFLAQMDEYSSSNMP